MFIKANVCVLACLNTPAQRKRIIYFQCFIERALETNNVVSCGQEEGSRINDWDMYQAINVYQRQLLQLRNLLKITYSHKTHKYDRAGLLLLLLLLLLLIYTFSVLSLQLKKLQRHNKSGIVGLSNGIPARGHKEVRRSTGHIILAARYSNQQRSKSRQNQCQVQPTENIGNLSA